MIGISMAFTIAVCVAGFSVIYAALDDTVGDFVARDVPAPVIPTQPPTEADVAQGGAPASVETPADDAASTEAPEREPTAEPEEPIEPTEDADEFQPDYQSSSSARLNFREEPSTSGGEGTVILRLEENTPLEYLGQDQPADDPAQDGERWMYFRIEDGTEGWLREIDVEPYEP